MDLGQPHIKGLWIRIYYVQLDGDNYGMQLKSLPLQLEEVGRWIEQHACGHQHIYQIYTVETNDEKKRGEKKLSACVIPTCVEGKEADSQKVL